MYILGIPPEALQHWNIQADDRSGKPDHEILKLHLYRKINCIPHV